MFEGIGLLQITLICSQTLNKKKLSTVSELFKLIFDILNVLDTLKDTVAVFCDGCVRHDIFLQKHGFHGFLGVVEQCFLIVA